MAEYENRYASRGVGGAGLGLGIAGTALGVMNGGLGNIFGGWNNGCCSDNMPINRYELSQEQKISELQSQIALRDANVFVDSKLLELYKYVDGKFTAVEKELCEQKVFNATCISNMSCISNQVAQLMALTKLVVPNTSICPGWGNVTVTPATTTA
jgi:hypothetical protein